MTQHSIAEGALQDPCGEFGPTQRWALVWFFSVIVLGVAVVCTLRFTDYYNYINNGEFFDYNAYYENRASQTHIPTMADDSRMHADLATIESRLNPAAASQEK